MTHKYLLYLLFSLISIIGFFESSAQNDLEGDIQKLEKFLKNLDQNYVDQVETKSIVETGIKSMLEELDPHSVYFTKEAYERANEPLKGAFKGVGVRFLMIQDTMTILDVIDGGSAAAGGIEVGDKVFAINGDTIAGKGMRSSAVVRKIKSDDSEVAKIDLQRTSRGLHETLNLELSKTVIDMSSVPAYFMLDDRTGYIKLERFSSTSLSDVREGMDYLKKKKAKNLVLDLRGNGGGYLNVAIKIVDEFLEDRKLIVYTEGEHQEKRETFATSGGRFIDGDLYVLIDANSASASEIFAGAIQDWDRGLIVGRRSYGKGLVQRTVEFSDGSAMRLTISRYYTPTGRSIQRPYDKGLKVYQEELQNRIVSGELYSADSILLDDSLVYYTPNNRKVFGGGGIVPDVFVPIDSSKTEDLIRNISRKGLFDGYALKLLSESNAELKEEFADASSFLDKGDISEEQMNLFADYLTRRGIEVDTNSFLENTDLIKERLIIPLTRYLYGYPAYFEALAKYDNDVKAVKKEIERGTYKELGLR